MSNWGKPHNCPIRKTEPKGSMYLCDEHCYAFAECERVTDDERYKNEQKNKVSE